MDTFKFDISDAFQTLKESLICKSCNKLESTASFLVTCGHQVCTSCCTSQRGHCPICKTSFTKKDIIKRDDCVLPIINKINSIEAKLARHNYKIDKLPSDILDDYSRKNRNLNEKDKVKPTVATKEFMGQTSSNLQFVCKEIGPNLIRIVENTGKRNSKGETQLHTLAKRGKLKDLKEIIEKGADVNAVDWTNWTPLHEAVQAGAIECAELLLQSGALINVPGDNYDTPLHSACESRNIQMVKLLLSYGANINAKNFLGQTAMEVSGNDLQQVLETTKAEIKINPIYYIDKSHVVFVCCVSQETKNCLTNNKFTCNSVSLLKHAAFCVIGDEVKLDKIEILFVILKGMMVLRENDLDEYLAKDQLIQPNLIPEGIRPSVLRSLQNRMNRFPKLFDRLNFHVIGHQSTTRHDTEFSKSNIINLIKEGDGKILVRSPTEATAVKSQRPFHTQQTHGLVECCNFIVYNKVDAPLLMYNMKELRHVSSDWILDCIRLFKITD